MSDWEDEMDNEEKYKNEVKNEEGCDDWENEMDNETNEEKKGVFSTKIDLESEELIKQEIVKQKQNEPGTKNIDYEAKYYERNKDTIEFRKEILKAVEGITDDDLRLKKIKELEALKQAEQFLGVEEQKKNEQKALELEKDYIQLAQKSAAKINEAKRPVAFSYTYLKCCLDELLDILPQNKVNDLYKVISTVFNKKLKEEGGKKSSKKPNIKVGKNVQSDNKKGKIYEDEAGYDEDYEEEEFDDVFDK